MSYIRINNLQDDLGIVNNSPRFVEETNTVFYAPIPDSPSGGIDSAAPKSDFSQTKSSTIDPNTVAESTRMPIVIKVLLFLILALILIKLYLDHKDSKRLNELRRKHASV